MLRKGDVNRAINAYWCVVAGSEIWLVDGAVPFGSAEQLSLPVTSARPIGEYSGSPVMWLNLADLEHDLPLVSLRDCLHFPEPLCSGIVNLAT